mgnify:CR=1 FL=1
MPVVKYGRSRQLTVPKEYSERLGVEPGDVFDVVLQGGKLVYTPKTLIDKQLDDEIEEGLADIREGRTYGPFDTAEETIESLHKNIKAKKS